MAGSVLTFDTKSGGPLPEPQVEAAIDQPFLNISHDLETQAVLLEQRGKFQKVVAAQKRGEQRVVHLVTEPVHPVR